MTPTKREQATFAAHPELQRLAELRDRAAGLVIPGTAPPLWTPQN